MLNNEMMPYVYDGIVIVLIVVGALLGAKRGVLRSVLGIIFTAAAFIGAALLSNEEICEHLYMEYIRDDTMSIISSAMENAKKEVRDKVTEKAKQAIDDAVDKHLDTETSGSVKDFVADFIDAHREDIDKAVSSAAKKLGIDIGAILNDEKVSRKIDEAAKLYSETAAAEINDDMPLGITVQPSQIEEIITDKKLLELFIDEVVGLDTTKTGFDSTADYIEERILRPVILRALRIVIWIIAFLAIKLVLSLIMGIILLIKEIPVVNAADALLGFFTGIIGGAALTVFVAVSAYALIHLTGGMTYINDDIIAKTHIFRLVYSIIGAVGFTPIR